MTEGQIRFQSLRENQRHNEIMEKISASEADVRRRQVQVQEEQLPYQTALLTEQAKSTHEQAALVRSQQILNASNIVGSVLSNGQQFFKYLGAAANFVGLFA